MKRFLSLIAVLAGLSVWSAAQADPLRLNTLLQSDAGAKFSVRVDAAPPLIDPTCEEDVKKVVDASSTDYLVAYTPPDPIETFNNAISDCLSNIQSFDVDVGSGSILSFAFSAIMDMLMDQLFEQIMGAVCEGAQDTWNNAIGNALTAIQTGTNQSGLQQFSELLGSGGGSSGGLNVELLNSLLNP